MRHKSPRRARRIFHGKAISFHTSKSRILSSSELAVFFSSERRHHLPSSLDPQLHSQTPFVIIAGSQRSQFLELTHCLFVFKQVAMARKLRIQYDRAICHVMNRREDTRNVKFKQFSGGVSPLAADHWSLLATQWPLLRPPLRPGPEDIDFTLSRVLKWQHENHRAAPSLMVLGVTPELCRLPLHGNSRLVAVDKSPHMIQAHWRPLNPKHQKVICADWRHLPLKPASLDWVLADCALTALAFPSGYLELLSRLRKALRPGGGCLFRCLVQSEKREDLAAVFAAPAARPLNNFHAFKLRLLMALQQDTALGVALGDAHDALSRAWKDPRSLARHFGFPLAETQTILAYRNVNTRYSFPTLSEHRKVFSQAGFEVAEIKFPSYELGERCPGFRLKLS
jgi:SAM-dependent methyltransferase